MNMKKILLIGLSAFLNLSYQSCGWAEESEEPLVVRLETESKLSPLYLLPIDAAQAEFSNDYVPQLEKILSFDLDHNGATFIAKRTAAANQIGQNSPSNQVGTVSEWKGKRVSYVVKAVVEGKTIKATVLDIPKQSLKTTTSLNLTGNLNEDRRTLHRLSDTIHKALFGIDGIASTRIIFTIKTGVSKDSSKWVSEVWEADYDGANLKQLTDERSTCVTPTYLPPKPGAISGAFVYVSYQLGQPKIFISNLKTGKKQRVSWMRGNQLMPAISRQRDKIAFICDITGNPDLFLQPFSPEQGAIGKPQQIFSAKLATQGSPTFSPDGKRVAFVSNKDGSPKIYVMPVPEPGANISEIKPTLVSKTNRENSAPSWSPDGTMLAYCGKSSGDRQIWIYDFNTRRETQVTQGSGNKENPSWAPNSLHLVYNSSDPKACNLFITNLNQSDPTQITSGSGEKLFPSWEPR